MGVREAHELWLAPWHHATVACRMMIVSKKTRKKTRNNEYSNILAAWHHAAVACRMMMRKKKILAAWMMRKKKKKIMRMMIILHALKSFISLRCANCVFI
jgi:hypothetical protein